MKEASTYLESPMSKSKWSSVVKSKVREYWSSHIHTMSQMYSSLQFLNSKSIYKGNVHPILKHKYYSALIIDIIPIKLRIVTGTYELQTKRINFYRDESDPTCLLCGNAEETIQTFHFRLSETWIWKDENSYGNISHVAKYTELRNIIHRTRQY